MNENVPTADAGLPTIWVDFNSLAFPGTDERAVLGRMKRASRWLSVEDRVLAKDHDGYECEAVVSGVHRAPSWERDGSYFVYLALDMATWKEV